MSAPSRRCCKCNRTAKCVRCSCTKTGKPCSCCLPGDLGKCQNKGRSSDKNIPHTPTSTSSVPTSSGGQLSSSSRVTLVQSESSNTSVPPLVPPCITSPHPAPAPQPPAPSQGSPPPNVHVPLTPISSSIAVPSLPSESSLHDLRPLPPLDSILRLRVPTLQHVPKAIRDSWSLLLSDVLSEIFRNPLIISSWCKLFMLSKCILSNPPRGGRSHWRATLKLVQSRIQRWKDGDLSGLWSDTTTSVRGLNARSARSKSKMPSAESQRRSNATRARRAVGDGQYRKALQTLTSMGLALPSSDIFSEMLAKHPCVDPPTIPESPPPNPIVVSAEQVIGALRSFPAGSAPGPSGLRANHLKEAVFCPSPDRANHTLLCLSRVVNLLCSGKLPHTVIPHLCGASLLPCLKRGGGLRPIAVGEVLRRLTSKCVARAVLPEALQILSPLQVGVGVPAGCEAIIHSVMNIHESPSIPADHRFTLLVDFSNAFNSVDRTTLFHEMRSRIPTISSWLESSYGLQPNLLLGNQTIPSCGGVQQGDPLGPLGFALVLHPIIEKIRESVPGLLINVWYLDDGTLCGTQQDLAAALTIIEAEGPPRGLFLNRVKSFIHSPDNCSVTHPLLCGIPTSSDGFTLLGSPVGPNSFCEDIFSKRVSKIADTLSKLEDLEDSQMETALLRSCLALPKVAYLLRTCPPALFQQSLGSFDHIMRDALSDLAGGPLSDWSWAKASLPSSLGGLNVRQALLHAPAAYISSFLQSRPLISRILGHSANPPVHLSDSITSLSQASARPDWVSIQDIDVPHSQHSLSRAIDEASFDTLLASAPNSRSKALALSSAIRHAGDWLNAIPSSSLGLHLPDRGFRFCLKYWLGLQMFQEGGKCPVCHALADPFGDHQVGCGGNCDRIFRHNSIRDAVFSAAQSAALAPRREVPSLIPGTQSRPADIYLPCWKRGRPAALDITVISTLQQSTVRGAAENQGHALLVAEERKFASHGAACQAIGICFIPLAIESLGGMSDMTADTISSIGRLLGQRLGISPGESIRHLFQRLAISLWRGNASAWIHRSPQLAPSLDGVI